MNKKDVQKRKQVFIAICVAAVSLFTIYFVLVHSQQSRVIELNRAIAGVVQEIEDAQQSSKLAPKMESDMLTSSNRLYEAELKMANGDVYFWMVKRLEEFQRTSSVQFDDIDPPRIESSATLPKVKYSAARFNVTGRATYDHFGLFLAKFENNFPFMHLNGLELYATPSGDADSPNNEELRFKMELTILVGSNNTSTH